MLSTRFLVCLLAVVLFHTSAYADYMSDKTSDTVEATGIIYKEAFVNKGGRKIEGVFTWYFKTGDKSYFIKSCEGNTTTPRFVQCNGMQVKVSLSYKRGLWDVCDGNKNAQSRFGDYVAIYSLEVESDLNTYGYADGSGNVYKLTSDNLEYIPVKKENSSSGEYSGGEPAKVSVSKAQFDVLVSMMKGIILDKSIHIENREMMTGMIRVSYDDESDVTLFKKGDRMALLENALKFILNKK
ncbi:MAG: hypothetical protein ACHQF2_02695 [Flavobacteriales bacterium]